MPEVNNVSSEVMPMEEIRMDTTVLVIGGGWSGIKVACELVDIGYRVILIEDSTTLGGEALSDHLVTSSREKLSGLLAKVKDLEAVEVLVSTRLVILTGVPGDFRVWLEQEGKVSERTAGAVVVALEAETVSLSSAYGLQAAENVLTQSEVEAKLASGKTGEISKDVLFLVGLQQEGSPLVMERAIRSASQIQALEGCQAKVVVGNVKVAEHGLESLYTESRKSGIIYLKVKEPPKIRQDRSSLQIDVFDYVLNRDVKLTPDMVVVEDAFLPHPDAARVSRVLGIGTDSEGFFQQANVYYLPIRTNREGIFVIGSAREPRNLMHGWTDVGNTVLEVRNLLGEGKKLVPIERAKIHRGKCTICLTCVRVCPHGAIYWDNRAIISPVACQGCGICASECPMDAIQLVNYTDDQMEAQVLASIEKKVEAPQIIAFCCQNSAHEASQMARLFGSSLPEGLQMIKVPCAGKVDVDYILTAFEAGTDGVLVMACHKDNCKSQHGNTFAEWRVEHVGRMLEEIGLEKERVRFATVASNMPVEFVRITNEMEDTLKGLGPSRIKKQAAA
ncbi:MAG: hydrogenase iron-sulfur subunit [Proteobacteria bacterium]|nr:hydrogenase iron-sulfur subunit [Pseudomonadota bacterium]